jgi:hypothetical protein
MKKVIAFIIILCVIIIGISILNNIFFNKEIQSRKSAELLKDSLLHRRVEIQDLLLQKSSILDSMRKDNKSSISIIQKEIQKIKDNSDENLKWQKKIFSISKE